MSQHISEIFREAKDNLSDLFFVYFSFAFRFYRDFLLELSLFDFLQ